MPWLYIWGSHRIAFGSQFYHVSSEDSICVVRFHGKYLHTQSHLASPIQGIFNGAMGEK